MKTDPDLVIVHESMLNGLGQLSDYFGFSKVMGQLYGAVLLSPGPMCLDDFTERLNISKASVSMNLRTLEHLGMVRRVYTSDRGDRRKFYEAETDFWQIITNIISGREMRDVDRAIAVMEDNIERLRKAAPGMSEGNQEVAELYLQRIEQIEALFRFAQLVITTILAQVEEAGDVGDISEIKIE